MIGGTMNWILSTNWSDPFTILVWIGVLLAVVWTIMMRDDPANDGLPEWDLRLRRAGILTMVFGLSISVLFGNSQGWTPWPPMILVVVGFDFYLAAALLTSKPRVRMADRLRRLAQDERPLRWPVQLS